MLRRNASLQEVQELTATAMPHAQLQTGDLALSGNPASQQMALQRYGTLERLLQENMLLRQHLDRWRRLGAEVEERDRTLAHLLDQRKMPRGPQLLQAEALTPAMHQSSEASSSAVIGGEAKAAAAAAEPRPHRRGLEALVLVLLALAALLLASGAWRWRSPAAAPKQQQGSAWRKSSLSSLSSLLSQRFSGIPAAADCVVEVSEIRLGPLGKMPDHDDAVRVCIQAGQGPTTTSHAAPRLSGGYLTFREQFHIKVPRQGGSCAFWVVDQSGACTSDRVVMTMGWFLERAGKKQEYFRFDLQKEGGFSEMFQAEEDAELPGQPQLAMRLRELSRSPRPS